MSDREHEELQQLFVCIPELESVYWMRWGVTEVFDTAADRDQASERLEDFRDLLDEDDTEMQEFFATYDAHRDGILAYFDERKTSGVVEGLNNKARVITKRCYGVKKATTLWQRLCLDINVAAQAACRTVQQIKGLTNCIRVKFLGFYT